jgi:hypothetical protein
MTYNVNSNTAQIISRNDLTIFDEVTAISRQIIISSNNGDYTASVSSGTTMTDSTSYYDVWIGSTQDRKLLDQMNIVVSHFTQLGYQIQRLTNTSTNNTFIWKVEW